VKEWKYMACIIAWTLLGIGALLIFA